MTLKNLLRLLVLALAFVTCNADAPQASAPAPEAVTLLPQAARLRKLHLVRPDLIHYPLQLEIIC